MLTRFLRLYCLQYDGMASCIVLFFSNSPITVVNWIPNEAAGLKITSTWKILQKFHSHSHENYAVQNWKNMDQNKKNFKRRRIRFQHRYYQICCIDTKLYRYKKFTVRKVRQKGRFSWMHYILFFSTNKIHRKAFFWSVFEVVREELEELDNNTGWEKMVLLILGIGKSTLRVKNGEIVVPSGKAVSIKDTWE